MEQFKRRSYIKIPTVYNGMVWSGINLKELKTFLNDTEIIIKDNNKVLVCDSYEPFWILPYDTIVKNMKTGKLKSYSLIDFNNIFMSTINKDEPQQTID